MHRADRRTRFKHDPDGLYMIPNVGVGGNGRAPPSKSNAGVRHAVTPPKYGIGSPETPKSEHRLSESGRRRPIHRRTCFIHGKYGRRHKPTQGLYTRLRERRPNIPGPVARTEGPKTGSIRKHRFSDCPHPLSAIDGAGPIIDRPNFSLCLSSAHESIRRHRPVQIDANTQIVTLLGHPVEHSLSPRIHNAAFAAQGLNAVYLATPVSPDALGPAVDGLQALQFLGANVTVPHKEAVQAQLDDVSARAAAVGAVNTIVREDDGLRGDNTDVDGFLSPLVDTVGEDLHDAPMLIFGAGGAARAVVYGLLARYAPEQLTLVARRPEQAESLAADFSQYDTQDALRVTTFEDAAPAVRNSRLLVNATPLGMAPDHQEQTPWPEPKDFTPDHVAYDLVYNPAQTRFLQAAAGEGATIVGGLDMLVEQAAAAYTQWTDREMPRTAVYEALEA